jgi:xylulose-5-phosphate/fructose-6-phosphate phosphoketolase
MTVLNGVSRYHLVVDALHNAARTPGGAQALEDWCTAKLAEHRAYVREHMEDLPEIRDWRVAPPSP